MYILFFHISPHSLHLYLYSSTPPRLGAMLPPTTSPRRPMNEILGHYSKKDAGQVAVHLAQFYFFGESLMGKTTAARLDTTKIDEIKHLIVTKFGENRSAAVKEEIWRRCYWAKMQTIASKESKQVGFTYVYSLHHHLRIPPITITTYVYHPSPSPLTYTTHHHHHLLVA